MSTVLALLAVAAAANAAPHALIIGVNRSDDPSLATLRYADDDAARYYDLFRALGARPHLLAHLDENTARLHPAAAAEARPATSRQLEAARAALRTELQAARAAGIPTVLYVVYAGHGTANDGSLSLRLDDGHLTGRELAEDVLPSLPADATHLIVDACHSYLLARSRGPGGARRPVTGFSGTGGRLRERGVGLLLSSSSASESHEWDGFQAGVFSHEVRSGLYGAADADEDGQVTYREIAAFVDQANRSIPNERYRPTILARPAAGGEALVDLRGSALPALRIDGDHAGHYLLEDARGVRLADLHNALRQALTLRRPPGSRYYLRRLGDPPTEYALDDTAGASVGVLEAAEPRVAARGAAHEAFSHVFDLAFSAAVVDAFELAEGAVAVEVAPSTPIGDIVGWTAVASGLGGVAAAGALLAAASEVRASTPAAASNLMVLRRNGEIQDLNVAAALALCLGIGAAIGGAAWLWWPTDDRLALAALPGAANLVVRW